MARDSHSERRSGCPVSMSLEIFGDRWSLLVIRDLMVRGHRTFKEFEQSGEGIATNILSDRLHRLEAAGIITGETVADDARRINYRLTEKGVDLAPVMLELLIWGTRHEQTGAPRGFIEHLAQNREEVLAEVRRRWRERDLTPLIPKFSDDDLRTLPSGRVRHPLPKTSVTGNGRGTAPSLHKSSTRNTKE